MAEVPSGAAIASDFLKYAGAGYVYGGRADRPGDWDCSSAVSYVLGHDFGLALPGGGHYGDPGYPPNAHGPVVSSYIAWNGATTLGKDEAPQAGDLVCFGPDTHIGVVISTGQMISALDTQLGTVASEIGGAASGTIIYRRVNGVGQAPTGAGGTSATAGAASQIAGVVAALGVGAGVAGGLVVLVLGGTVLLGVVGSILVAAALKRAGVQ